MIHITQGEHARHYTKDAVHTTSQACYAPPKLITDDFLKLRMKSDRLIQVQWDKLGSDRLIPVRSSLSVGLKTEKNDKNHDFFLVSTF